MFRIEYFIFVVFAYDFLVLRHARSFHLHIMLNYDERPHLVIAFFVSIDVVYCILSKQFLRMQLFLSDYYFLGVIRRARYTVMYIAHDLIKK